MRKIADGRIIIDTEIDSKGAEKDINGLSGKLSSIAKTGLTAFTGAIVAAGTAIGGLAGIATKYNSQMEDYFANFTVLLGSATEATKHVEDLKDFAAKTPFEMAGLADASKQLLSFGIGVEDIMPDLQMLGDISLGNQERFKGLALVFAQVASAGKLTGQDLMQFINQGFNPLQSIAEKTGKSMAELKEEMSDGKITYEMVAEAMRVATSEGGKFYQGMEVQSKTLSGMWSTLKDDTMSLIGGAFEPFSEILKNSVMPALQGIVGKMEEAFKDPNIQASIANIAAGLGDFAVKIGELISDYLPKIIEGVAWLLENSNEIATGIIAIGTALMVLNVANMIMGLVKAFKAFKLANEGATVAQWLLNVAMSANPIGIVIAAIAGLIAGIVYLWNTNEGFRTAIINAWNAIKEAGILVWDWLVNFFTVDIPNAWNSVVEFFAGIPAWFGELWNTIKQAFIDGWQAITDFFTITIPSWIEQIFNWFNELPYKIGFALGNLLGTIVKWGTDTWSYLTTNVPIWIENVVTFFSKLPGAIWNWLVNTYNNIVKWGKDTWSSMYTTASNAISAVIDWFASLPGKIWSWLLSTISKVYQFGRDLGSKASEAGSNMVSNIINAVTNLPSKMAEIGSNIVRGVWNGITGMGSWIASKVSGFFSGIVDGAKAALGIHSPSRVFRDQVGKYMAQGVGVGFEDETDNVQKSMDDNFKNLVAKMQGTVDYETAMTTARVVTYNNKLSGEVDIDDNDPKERPIIVEAKLIVNGKEFTQEVVAPNQDVLTEYYEGR
ncbi:tape measure protein [Clostridium tertium]|uniref:tape measure protein n=1 Tax=Clostridium tertium TaxID=1559 RepID=UPI003DA2766F